MYSDQSLGAVHPFLYKKEEKIIKVGTIILISFMAMTCKIIAMFTISVGTLALKVTLLIYGWMSTPVVLVTSGLILLVKINKIKQKYRMIETSCEVLSD